MTPERTREKFTRIAERAGIKLRAKNQYGREQCIHLSTYARPYQCIMPAVSEHGLCKRHHKLVFGEDKPGVNDVAPKGISTEELREYLIKGLKPRTIVHPLIEEVLRYREKRGELE